MMSAAFFIFLFCWLFLCCSQRDRISVAATLYFFGISALFFLAGIYRSKVGYFSYDGYWDNLLSLSFSRMRISINTILRLYNLSLCGLLFSQALLADAAEQISKKKKILLFFPTLLVLFVNDPETAWSVYIRFSTASGSWKEFWRIAVIAIYYFDTAIKLFYMFYALRRLLSRMMNTMIAHIKVQMGVCFVCLLAIDILLLLSVQNTSEYNMCYHILMAFDNSESKKNAHYLLPALLQSVIYIFGILMVLHGRYGIFSAVNRTEFFNRNSRKQNICAVLHTYKNAFIAVKRLLDIAMENADAGDMELLRENLTLLRDMAGEKCNILNVTLRQIRTIKMMMQSDSIQLCIENAISEVAVPKEITVHCSYHAGAAMMLFDYEHMKEAFVNILSNAINSLKKKRAVNPAIYITVFTEEEYTIIVFHDNGVGIPKAEMGHIFEMFYSRDISKGGNGVGLSYVKNVVDAHGGFIEVKSREGEGAEFKIILPMKK